MLTEAIRWTCRDLRWGPRQFVINTVAGARLTPRLLRHVVYRFMGLNVSALDILSGVVIVGRSLSIGAGTFINHGVHIDAAHGVSIGADCAIGPGVMVLSSSHELTNKAWSHRTTGEAVEIGDKVWLGARALILPGARISSSAVIAAGSVVGRGEFGPGVWGGVPARLIKSLGEDPPNRIGLQGNDDGDDGT